MDTGMHMHHTAPADGETATDPVCGMTVAVNADAITREYEGKSYYFCGEHCATNFMKAPQVFLGRSPCGYLIPRPWPPPQTSGGHLHL